MFWKRKKKKEKNPYDDPNDFVRYDDEAVVDIRRQITLSEQEYDAITSYLSDIQKIERMSGARRQTVMDAARQICNLNRERTKFQNSDERIEAEKYWVMERYERQIPKELDALKEQEEYKALVEADLRQLAGERGVIVFEKEQAEEKIGFLRKLSLVGMCVVVLLFFSLLFVGYATGAGMTVPLLMTLAMGGVLAAYVVATSKNCEQIIQDSDRRMNRLIQLENRVKIKYVNCSGSLEYSYSKYGVENSYELRCLWERFVRTKDAEKRYRQSTELLAHYQDELTKALEEEGLYDPGIWVYQTDALLDEKEMVEVRHRLNVRRGKIRDRLESCHRDLSKYS